MKAIYNSIEYTAIEVHRVDNSVTCKLMSAVQTVGIRLGKNEDQLRGYINNKQQDWSFPMDAVSPPIDSPALHIIRKPSRLQIYFELLVYNSLQWNLSNLDTLGQKKVS